jgi:hypothetical protein
VKEKYKEKLSIFVEKCHLFSSILLQKRNGFESFDFKNLVESFDNVKNIDLRSYIR